MATIENSGKVSCNHIKVCCRIRPVNDVDETESVQICNSGTFCNYLQVINHRTFNSLNISCLLRLEGNFAF